MLHRPPAVSNAMVKSVWRLQALADLHLTHTHRDFKPENVLITDWDSPHGPHVVIIDWANCISHEG